jgi:hypothetical protein
MVKYDPLKDRSEEMGWTRVQDETPPTDAEQDAWARYALWFVAVFCAVSMFVFME